MQAKDIHDVEVLRLVRDSEERVDRHVVDRHYQDFPFKVVNAKLAKLIGRKLLDGCGGTCDCSTTITITDQGRVFLDDSVKAADTK